MIKKTDSTMDRQLLGALLALDMTHKEAQAYHALVMHGVMTAEDISKLIHVQHPIVYRTLEGLRAKGWIDSTTDRPKKYRAKHPKSAASSAGKMQIARINESVSLICDLLEPLYDENQEMLRQEIWTIRGLENVTRKITEMGSRVEKSIKGKVTGPIDDGTFNLIFSSTPVNIPLTVHMMGPPIVNLDKGLKKHIKILRPGFKEDCKNFPMINPSARTKEEFLRSIHGDRFISIHLLFDDKEALWINIPYRDNTVIQDKVWASWIIDPEYIEIIRSEA